MTEPLGAFAPDALDDARAVAAQAVNTGRCVDIELGGVRYIVVPSVVLVELAANGITFTTDQLEACWAEDDDHRRAHFFAVPDGVVPTFDLLREMGNADG